LYKDFAIVEKILILFPLAEMLIFAVQIKPLEEFFFGSKLSEKFAKVTPKLACQ